MIRPRVRTLVLITAMTAVALSAPGCRGKKRVEPPPPPPPPVEKPAPVPEVKVEKAPKFTPPPTKEPEVDTTDLDDIINDQNASQRYLRTVYFDFDRHALRPDAIATLKENAAWIKNSDPRLKVVIEGHCDERGTIEYNLELGSKRARAVQDYLTSLGVSGLRLRTISYGEERPADAGHNEAAWAKNRRGQFRLER